MHEGRQHRDGNHPTVCYQRGAFGLRRQQLSGAPDTARSWQQLQLRRRDPYFPPRNITARPADEVVPASTWPKDAGRSLGSPPSCYLAPTSNGGAATARARSGGALLEATPG